jgi:iron complex transport system permease protein
MTYRRLIYPLIFVSPIICIFFSLFWGRFPISIGEVTAVLLHRLSFLGAPAVNETQIAVIEIIRLPRALFGALVGGALAISGAAFQGLFRNPLVSSGMLGVSSGAGFGAALAILLFSQKSLIYIFAFTFGIAAVVMAYMIGRIYRTTTSITLVLGGIVVGSIFAALTSFAKYVADPYNQLPTIVFWLMGSLASAQRSQILLAGIPMFIGSAGLILMRWRINILSMGERESQALGVNLQVSQLLIVFFATLATAGAVSIAGVIGWVGLVVPHMGRMIVGSDNRVLLPVSFCLGASFLILVDTLARTITGSEIPLGVLTALVGGPFFIYLLKETKARGW